MVVLMLHTTAITTEHRSIHSYIPPLRTHCDAYVDLWTTNKDTAAAQTLAKWLVIHGLTTVFPNATLCIAGVSLISNIPRE